MRHDLSFRFATPSDTTLILSFIKQLAAYEKRLDMVTATEAQIHTWLFEKEKAEVLFAVLDGREIGFALFFYSFSTFAGKAGLFLEDLLVLPEYRGNGYGKALFAKLAQTAIQRGCGELEWRCLTWNDPAIAFYTGLGAISLHEWSTYRLSADKLEQLASQACAQTR